MSKESESRAARETIIVVSCILAAIAIIWIVVYFQLKKTDPKLDPRVDAFANCIKNSGAVFYGASWCSHCNKQKELFGNSENLPYIECSTPDGKKQLSVCSDKKIESYPTWIFADDTRESGSLSFERLAVKTGCQF